MCPVVIQEFDIQNVKTQSGLSVDNVRKLALALADVEESTAYGKPAFLIHGNMLACIASHKSAEPGTLVVCIPIEERAKLLVDKPNVFYLKDHYLNHSSILVRLLRVDLATLRKLFADSWKFVRTKPHKKRRTPRTLSSKNSKTASKQKSSDWKP